MLKKKFLPIIINFLIFIFALSAYYNYSFQYYLKIDIRKIGLSNTLFQTIVNQNSSILVEKIFHNSNFFQDIEIQNINISRENVLIFFKKKKNFDLNNFLEEEFDYEELFKYLITSRDKDFNFLTIFINEIENPPDSIVNEVRQHYRVTRELETLILNKNVHKFKTADVLEKNPSLLDICIFSITYLLLSTVLILNIKKIRKFIS